MNPIENILKDFEGIRLKEMDKVRLMDRTDTKYMMNHQQLMKLLPEMHEDYRVLDIDGVRISTYRSLYYDTEKSKFYLDHHNGKTSRYKVRFREYIESDLSFLEVKHKYKGRTQKKRIKINKIEEELSEKSKNFINNCNVKYSDVSPSLWNKFQRITLVNKYLSERLTIDLNLTFKWGSWEHKEEELVIIEVKQEDLIRESCFMQLAKAEGIRPYGISKYCIGRILSNDKLKYNNFKPKLLALEKVRNGHSV